MARTEARISVEIWNDPDFKALSRNAQGMYAFLISQQDLLHIGLIGIRLRRWASAAAGLTPADVERDLQELEAARFIVADWDAEELLIRTFLRGDKVYRQAQVLAAAASQVTLVTSLTLRVALRVELERIAALEMNSNCAALVAQMLDQLADATQPSDSKGPDVSPVRQGGPHPPEHPADEGDRQSLGDRGMYTTVTTDSPSPLPLDPNPDPKNTSSADALPLAALAEPESKTPRARADPKDFEQFWEIYPRREAKGAARKAWAQAIKKAPVDEILAGARAYRDDGARQRSEPKFTKLPATWLNAECWTDERPSRASPVNANGHQPYRNPTDPSIYEGDL